MGSSIGIQEVVAGVELNTKVVDICLPCTRCRRTSRHDWYELHDYLGAAGQLLGSELLGARPSGWSELQLAADADVPGVVWHYR